MTSGSLAARLFLAGALWSATSLIAAGLTLSSYHRETVERNFDQRLYVFLKTLVANFTSHGDMEKVELSALGEPRFDQAFSGWYWQIIHIGDKPESKVSRSLVDQNLPSLYAMDPDKDTTATRETYIFGPEEQPLRMIERVIDFGNGSRYALAVAGDASEIDFDTDDFNTTLLVSFCILGVGMVGMTLVQVIYGLRPLQKISERIAAIRSGDAKSIDGAVPREIAPLTKELNALIESNSQVIERARTHVGNLAHALKTPLSVITNEAAMEQGLLAEKVTEQAQIMRRQIDHHLDRARIAAGVAMVGAASDVNAALQGLVNTMKKVHRDKTLELDLNVSEVTFRGERQDLEEMVGNLLDNACKWAKSRVSVEAFLEAQGEPGERPFLRICVDDDGPGLTAAEREQILARGRRLDETKPGSGLGLAIVSDLASLYGGKLCFRASPAGGTRAELRLPSA